MSENQAKLRTWEAAVWWASNVWHAFIRTFWFDRNRWVEALVSIAGVVLAAVAVGTLADLEGDFRWLIEILAGLLIVFAVKFGFHLLMIPAARSISAERTLTQAVLREKLVEEVDEMHNKGDLLLRTVVSSSDEYENWLEMFELWRKLV